MNFLVSKNPVLIDRFWSALQENGASQLLSDFSDLLLKAKNTKTRLVILDAEVDGFKGMSSIAKVRHSNQTLKILLINSSLTVEDELSALAAGASGSCTPDLLPEKIRRIFASLEDDGVWISSSALPLLLQHLKLPEKQTEQHKPQKEISDIQGKIATLTPRERQVTDLVAKGVSNKIIARELNIADRTVKTHLSVIFQKLKVNDRLQLALLALKN